MPKLFLLWVWLKTFWMQIQILVLYTLKESAITKQMVIDRGIDPNRMVLFPVTTVQKFRTH